MSQTNLIYQVEDKPSWGKTIVFALQQLRHELLDALRLGARIVVAIPFHKVNDAPYSQACANCRYQ